MRKWLVSIILILAMFFPSAIKAQDPVELSSLQIAIWPEFDKPSVLVIYQLTLSSNTLLPASVSLRIPISAGDPNAVAARQVDGSLYSIDSTRQLSGQWSIISFTTPTPEVQLEYYDPGLVTNGKARHFTYTWPGDYTVSQLTIQIQQPTGATNMRISPSLGSGKTGSDGLTYYTQDIGSVAAGQTIQISLDYQKSNNLLTAETLPVKSSAPIPQGASSDINPTSWLPWVLGILGAGLIIGGVIWFWQTGRQVPSLLGRRQQSHTTSYEQGLNFGASGDAVYCSQCGKRALPGDQFCRACGSPIHNK
jgi:hypothetical protein